MSDLGGTVPQGPIMEKADRFWALVDQGAADVCWPWLGKKDKAGYGLWGHLRSAHVYAWLYGRGPLIYGLELDHLCNRRDCCNPAHLEQVTHAENMRRVAARRTHCVNGHPRAEEGGGPGKNPCRACNREAQARWRQAHPEEHRLAQQKKYQRAVQRRRELQAAAGPDEKVKAGPDLDLFSPYHLSAFSRSSSINKLG